MSKQPLCEETVLTAKGLFVGLGTQGFRLRVPHLTGRAGEIVALIGGNATGKSSLLYTLATMHSPVEGTITYLVPDGHEPPRTNSARVGTVSRGTPRSAVTFATATSVLGRRYRGCSRASRCAKTLRCERPWEAGTPAVSISCSSAWGWSVPPNTPRRLEWRPGRTHGPGAGAYGGPTIVILDEPTAQVDARTVPDLLAMARAYARQGRTRDLFVPRPSSCGIGRRPLLDDRGGECNRAARLVFPFQDHDDPDWFETVARRHAAPGRAPRRRERAAPPSFVPSPTASQAHSRSMAGSRLHSEKSRRPTAGGRPLAQRVVPSFGTVRRYAVRENTAPGAAPPRLAGPRSVALAVASFTSLSDLGQGVAAPTSIARRRLTTRRSTGSTPLPAFLAASGP